MAAVVQAQPWRALALIKYFDIIQRAYSFFLDSMWIKYDEMFVMQASLNSTLPWDRKETELWTELVTQDRLAIGQQSDSDHHLLYVAQPKAVEAKSPPPPTAAALCTLEKINKNPCRDAGNRDNTSIHTLTIGQIGKMQNAISFVISFSNIEVRREADGEGRTI